MKFRDIKQFPFASYKVNVPWSMLKDHIEDHSKHNTVYSFDMDPEYQRGYVWTKAQKMAYIEYRLQGGFSGRDIFWNCPHWMSWRKGDVMELVDGKQRIQSVLDFLDDKIKAFGLYYSEFEDELHSEPDFVMHVNNLESKEEIIEWYINFNTGGSIHTTDDLQPAYDLLKKIRKNKNENSNN